MKTLLIVDDTPEDREVLARIFSADQDGAYEVLEATDATTCFEILAQRKDVHCILLDYSMPGRDGLRVLQDLLSQFPHIPIVMVTGQGSQGIAVEALKLGAQDYVVKNSFSTADIRRRVELALEHKKMERLLARQQQNLRDFADILVHDLRAPLRSIKGPIEMLVNNDGPIDDEMQAKLFGFITDSVEQMDRIILSLQQFSVPQQSQTAFEVFPATQLFEYIQNALADDISATGTKLTFQPNPPDIWGSLHLLRLLLMNLVDNAIKYRTKPQGSIHVALTDRGDAKQLSVSDDGIGIAQKHLLDIFEPFKRLHSGLEIKGTGLGLATCLRIAEQHDAALICQSELGKGTTFVLTLPEPTTA